MADYMKNVGKLNWPCINRKKGRIVLMQDDRSYKDAGVD